MKFNYSKIVGNYRKWVDRNRGLTLDPATSSLPELESFILSGTSEGNCRGAGLNLEFVANWNGRLGVTEISDGRKGGWSLLAKAAMYQYWDIRIRCRSYDNADNKRKASNFTPSALDVGRYSLYCFAFEQESEAIWLTRRLEQGREDGSVGAWSWEFPTTYLAIAVSRCLESGALPVISDLKLGVYEPIFRWWQNEDRFQKALLAAAEYHVEHIYERRNDEIFEFGRSPFDVFPMEIHAIFRMRERLNESIPKIDHPLMNTPFGEMPPSLPNPEDELLDRVIAKVREIMPGI